MNLPYIKLVLPVAIKQYKNGQLPTSVLAQVNAGGRMYSPVAIQFNKLYDEAFSAGFKLINVGDYRSFQGQVTMFLDRYSLTDTGRSPQITRQYQGKTWYLKSNKSPSAAPDPTGLKGSNHGWGLAIDLGYYINGKLTSMGGSCFDWMCVNAPKYGFYLQTDNRQSKEFEAWHWQYCLGDKLPSGVAYSVPTGSSPMLSSVSSFAMKFDYPGTPIKLGSTGVSAMLVQAMIGDNADGNFDIDSVTILKKWQLEHKLKDDGVVGPVTWGLMF